MSFFQSLYAAAEMRVASHATITYLNIMMQQPIMRCVLAIWCVFISPTINAQSSATTSSSIGNNAIHGRVSDAVAEAKAKGATSISLPALKKMPTGVNTLAKAAERYSLLIAQPVSANTIVRSGESIETWYRLEVTQVLQTQIAIPEWADPPVPSSQNLPSTNNQLLLPISGGQVTISGVNVREQTDQEGPLKIGTTYLFIVHLEAKGKVAVLASPDSVFQVGTDSDTLEPIAPTSPLTKDLVSSYQASLAVIRNKLKALPQK